MGMTGSKVWPSTPDNRLYLFQLQLLLIDGGLLVLRSILDRHLNASRTTLAVCLNNERSTITNLRKRNIITDVQYDTLFPTGVQTPTTSDLDITLIICLLRGLRSFGLNKNFDWKATPAQSDVSLEADIWRLKDYRNKILIRQSPPGLNIQQYINDFRSYPFDPEIEKRIQKESQKWEDVEEKVDRLQKVIAELERAVDDLTRRHDDNNKENPRQEQRSLVQRFLDWFRYRLDKKNIKKDLIRLYRHEYSTISLSPLVEENDTPLAGFYVMPKLTSVKQKSLTNDIEEKIPVSTLKDLFTSENEDHEEIFLSADAGFGKTSFSKYLTVLWCQCQRKDGDYNCFKKEDLQALSEFDFLFLVLLRDSTTFCSVDEMIEEQIIQKLPPSASQNSLQEILRKEKCLIILDGLDEWTHPDNDCTDRKSGIPHRYVRKNCVILTTTRPWKFAVLNIKKSRVNKKVEISHLTKDATWQLAKNALRKITGETDENLLHIRTQEISKEIRHCEIQTVPLLLMYLICLRCNDVAIGTSKHEIYVNIINFLLSRTQNKHKEIQISTEFFLNDQIAENFRMDLGKLAYKTLFDNNRKSTLVFDETVAREYLSDQGLTLSFLSGILTKSATKTLTKQISKVSFPHKTVQEFFAAIFICSQSDSKKTVLEKCKSPINILDMSTVCQFISGRNATKMFEISEYFKSVINKDGKTREYRRRAGGEIFYRNSLYHIQKMLVSCLKEMPGNENKQLCLQDVFISGHTKEDLKLLIEINKNNIKSLNINNSRTSSSLHEIIDFYSLDDLGGLQKLYYKGNKKEEAEIDRLLSPCLKSLSLSDGNWTNCEEILSKQLKKIQTLQCLFISNFTFDHKFLKTFLNVIASKNTLEEVTLSGLCGMEQGCNSEKMKLDVSQHSHLTKVDIERLPPLQLNITTPSLVNVTLKRIDLGEGSLLLSPEMLNIEHVKLSYVDISAKCLQNNVKVLENLPQSVTVEMDRCRIEPEIESERFRNYIRSSQTFQVTSYEGWKIEFNTSKTREKGQKEG